MTRRKTIAISLFGILMFSGVVLMAGDEVAESPRKEQKGGISGQRPPEERPIFRLLHYKLQKLAELKSELDITIEQREAIQMLTQDHRKEVASLIKKTVDKRRALKEAVRAERATEESIRFAAHQLGGAIGDLAVASSQVVTEIQALLTLQQLEVLQQYRADHQKDVDQLLDEVLVD